MLPRILKAGGDTSCIHLLRSLVLPARVDRLEATANSLKAGLIVIDPAHATPFAIADEEEMERPVVLIQSGVQVPQVGSPEQPAGGAADCVLPPAYLRRIIGRAISFGTRGHRGPDARAEAS